MLCIREQSYPSIICYYTSQLLQYNNSFAALMMKQLAVCAMLFKQTQCSRCQNDGFLQDLISFHHKCNRTDCNCQKIHLEKRFFMHVLRCYFCLEHGVLALNFFIRGLTTMFIKVFFFFAPQMSKSHLFLES